MSESSTDRLLYELLMKLDSIESRLTKLENTVKQKPEGTTLSDSPPAAEPKPINVAPPSPASSPVPIPAPAPPPIEATPLAPEVQPTVQVLAGQLEQKTRLPGPILHAIGNAPEEKPSFALDKLHSQIGNAQTTISSSDDPLSHADRVALETKIGSYWLNRIGLLALLIGVIFLLLYTFQYFGAGLKIAFGFLLAAGMIYASRTRKLNTRPWFANGLNALGWSIGFFTGYAMYFVPDLKVVPFAPLELIALTAIAAGTMYDAVRARSEFTALQGATFAALSICLAHDTVNPFFGLLIILIASSAVSVRQSWFALLFYNTLTYYVSFFYVSRVTHPDLDYALLGYLICGWLSAHCGVYFAQQLPDTHRVKLVWTSMLNALCATWFATPILHTLINSPNVSGYLVSLSSFGVAYLVTSKLFERKGDESLSTLHQLIGLSFINIGKWGKFTGVNNAVADIIQFGLLSIVGLKYNIKAFAWFAFVLALINVPEAIDNGWMVGWLAVTVYASAAYLYRDHANQVKDEKEVYIFYSNYYLGLTNIIAGSVINKLQGFNHAWKCVLFAAQALINTLIAIRTRDKVIATFAVGILGFNALNWSWVVFTDAIKLQLLLGTLMFFGFAYYARMRHLKQENDMEKAFKETYTVAGTLLLTALMWKIAPEHWLAELLCTESIALIALALVWNELWLWGCGMGVFALAAIGLMTLDLTYKQTILCIVMQFVFYLYCRHHNKIHPEPNTNASKNVFGIYATILLTAYLLKNMAASLLTIAIGLEGMVLVTAGFVLKEKFFRLSGLTVFGIVALRLLFVDLKSAPTITRIVSFIATGVMLVACSYAYGWFSKMLISDDSPKDPAPTAPETASQPISEIAPDTGTP